MRSRVLILALAALVLVGCAGWTREECQQWANDHPEYQVIYDSSGDDCLAARGGGSMHRVGDLITPENEVSG